MALQEWLMLPIPYFEDRMLVPFILDALQIALVPKEKEIRFDISISSTSHVLRALDKIYQHMMVLHYPCYIVLLLNELTNVLMYL